MAQHVLHTSLADMAAALQAAALQAAAPSSITEPFDTSSSSHMVWQTAAGAWANLLLRDSLSTSLQGLAEGAQLQALLQDIELPLQAVLSDMEVTGVRCDKQLLLEQRAQLQVRPRGGVGGSMYVHQHPAASCQPCSRDKVATLFLLQALQLVRQVPA
jgi:DNA polymerase I-like protein with 3'-5' exonuclease and polymerase domains